MMGNRLKSIYSRGVNLQKIGFGRAQFIFGLCRKLETEMRKIRFSGEKTSDAKLCFKRKTCRVLHIRRKEKILFTFLVTN